MTPVKPPARQDKTSLWNYMRAFRRDILSAQPQRLYRAWMAEFRTPFFRSYMINQTDLVKTVLKTRPEDFPKSTRISEGLRPLLGDSVFLTNGAQWQAQRRIIDPAFEGGRLREVMPSMQAAANAAVDRIEEGVQEFEELASYAAADVIFRTLFSIPITHDIAAEVFQEFRTYQRAQPILNIAAFVPLPRWMPRFHSRATRRSAARIRNLITELTRQRADQIAAGTAPDDLATKIMTTPDPETGRCFEWREMVDQVAIFFLAGHETSASALAWAFYLLAENQEVQTRLAEEVRMHDLDIAGLSKMPLLRGVFREALRLYPPVPMMVRETTYPEAFRDRTLPTGSQLVLSPWHLHRHERLWDDPDAFDPERYTTENGKTCLRDAFIPFSAGARVCPGAGFAMIEGPLLIAAILRKYRVTMTKHGRPVPVAHLTVRAKDGIWLNFQSRD
jgi:cytochrome P450